MYLSMYVLPACVWMAHMLWQQLPEEGSRSAGAWLKRIVCLLVKCLEQKPVPLEEEPILLSAKQSLHL